MACYEIRDGVGIIPEGITEICDYAFSGCEELEEIVIPNSVKTIGRAAFMGCTRLAYVTLPDGLKEIGDYAFTDCTGLICVYSRAKTPPVAGFFMLDYFRTLVDNCPLVCCTICVPADSLEAYRTAKHWCNYGNLIFSYDFEKDDFAEINIQAPLNNEIWYTNGSVVKATNPKEDAFNANILSNLYHLETKCWIIKFDNDITSIGYDAFRDCNELITVTVPDTLREVGLSAFDGCKNLLQFNGKSVSDDGRCIVLDGALEAFAPAGITEYSIPGNVTSIASKIFCKCNNLVRIEIPNGVLTIGYETFKDCSNIESITLPDSVTTIYERAFEGCSSLKGITIPGGVRVIGERTFYNCWQLSYANLNDGVTKIAYAAFSNCDSLKKIIIPDSVTEIGENAFEDCCSLIEVDLPCGITKISNNLFYKCTSLKNVRIPSSIISIGEGAFFDCTGLISITLPDCVLSIEKYAFSGCINLRSIIIPDSVKFIECSAFSNCPRLWDFKGKFSSITGSFLIIDGILKAFAPAEQDAVIIPDNVTCIDEFVFSGCINLKSVTIPESVSMIKTSAFTYCENLSEVYCMATKPPMLKVKSLSPNVFYGSSTDIKFYVPNDSLSTYKSSWHEYADHIIGFNFMKGRQWE